MPHPIFYSLLSIVRLGLSVLEARPGLVPRASHLGPRLFGLSLLFGAITTSQAQSPSVKAAVDWGQFLGRHDLVWESGPKVWHEAAFIGNGLVGATIYSEGTNLLQWDVGRSDVVDRGGRIAIGRFVLVASNVTDRGEMRLDLWNAEARGTLLGRDRSSRQPALQWRSFTHADKLVTVVELTEPVAQPPAQFLFQPSPALPAREVYQKTPIPEPEQNPPPALGDSGGVQWCLQSFKAGGGYAVAWAERKLSPGRREFTFSVAYTKRGAPSPGKAVEDIQSALKAEFDVLVQSHREWWHAYYPQSFLSIPDTRMESFYWIQMYKLASGTRADRPALDLMGPWFRSTPWPKIWWNLNIQLTYWPVYTANRLALGKSLTRMLDANVANLISNVPPAWRADSAAVGRSCSYDCIRPLKGAPGEERGDLTWALHNYWLQYRYSGDEAMLRERLYPLLKRAIGFYLHLLQPGEDGRLHLPRSISPEYPDQAPDTNFDLSLLRWGLQTLLATDQRLHLNDALAARWRETLAKLPPYSIDAQTGYMIGAGVPLAKSHRHYSHLFMFYPLHLVDPESAADRPLMEQSLAHWLSLPSALRGYSYTGAGAMSAWLGRRDDAARLLDVFLEPDDAKALNKYHIKPNTMYTEAGPVIETPLSGAATLHEIVLQSWSLEPFGTHLRVFPAVPDGWKEVSFDKLLAEGAFEVSASRRDGQTKFVQITSLAGAPCRVATSLAEPVIARGSRAFHVVTEPDRNGKPLTTVDLRQGETVVLTSANANLAPADLEIKPVAAQPGRTNFYGSLKAGR